MAGTSTKASTPGKSDTITDRKMKKVMHEYKEGELESSSGDKVRSRKQAIAIGLSEARQAGGKAPPAPKDSKRH